MEMDCTPVEQELTFCFCSWFPLGLILWGSLSMGILQDCCCHSLFHKKDSKYPWRLYFYPTFFPKNRKGRLSRSLCCLHVSLVQHFKQINDFHKALYVNYATRWYPNTWLPLHTISNNNIAEAGALNMQRRYCLLLVGNRSRKYGTTVKIIFL
jgi:hypothetical protein